MDVNGTRYHLLLGYADWSACRFSDRDTRRLRDVWGATPPTDVDAADADDEAHALAWDGERAEVTLHPRLFSLLGTGGEHAVTPADRRGAGRDRYGNWYWID